MTMARREPAPGISGQASENRSIQLSDGRRLAYAEYGARSGVPIMGFHGTPGSRLMFRIAHKVAFKMGIRIVAPDRPGFGLSSFQRNRTLSNWASDVEQLADHLGLDRFGVAGISGGGPYVASCASLLPDRVGAAAMISPMGPVHPSEGPDAIGSAQRITFRLLPFVTPAMRGAFSVGRLMFLRAPTSMYGVIMGRACESDWRILSRPAIRLNLLEGLAEGIRPGVRGAVQEMKIFGKAWSLPLQDIRAPVLVWQGTADRNVPVAAALHLAKLIPDCTLSVLEGAGHYWVFDHMEEVLTTIAHKMNDWSAR